MNKSQLGSLFRSILKAGSGALVAHGVTQGKVTEWVIGAVPGVVAFLWSHFVTHAEPAALTPPPTATTTGATK